MKRLLVRVLINIFEKTPKEGNTVCIDHPKNLREGKILHCPTKVMPPRAYTSIYSLSYRIWYLRKGHEIFASRSKKTPVMEQIPDLPFIS